MRIAVVGGTGREGRGLAVRWAKAGYEVMIGSREADKAREKATELSASSGSSIDGGDNASVVREADLVVLSVPYAAHGDTLRAIASDLAGKILVDITVPLRPPAVTRVTIPPGGAAALEAQSIVGASTPVVAALHHVSSTHLADASHPIDCDVLVAADDERAKGIVMDLLGAIDLRGLDAGPLANAVALESLTPVLLFLGKRYKTSGVGVRFTSLP